MALSTPNSGGDGIVADHLAENYDNEVARGANTYAGIARMAVDGGDPALARWAADRASAAELRQQDLTRKNVEDQANDAVPPGGTGNPDVAPVPESDAAKRTADSNAPSSKR